MCCNPKFVHYILSEVSDEGSPHKFGTCNCILLFLLALSLYPDEHYTEQCIKTGDVHASEVNKVIRTQNNVNNSLDSPFFVFSYFI